MEKEINVKNTCHTYFVGISSMNTIRNETITYTSFLLYVCFFLKKDYFYLF